VIRGRLDQSEPPTNPTTKEGRGEKEERSRANQSQSQRKKGENLQKKKLEFKTPPEKKSFSVRGVATV